MHAVAQLIHNRLNGIPDDAKIALVAEDGGQKWVMPGGMVARLTAHGIGAEIIGGASGGGLAVLYYATGSAITGALVLENLSSRGFALNGKRRFINPWRLLRGGPIMDVEGTVDDAFTLRRYIGWHKLKNMTTPMFLIATKRDGQKVVQRLDGMDVEQAKLAAKNTARIPWVAHSTRDKNVLWDGSLSEALPIDTAFELGATHVLVLRTHAGKVQKTNRTDAWLVQPVLNVLAPTLAKLWHSRTSRKNAMLAKYKNDPRVLLVSLPHISMGSTETDERNLLEHVLNSWQYLGQVLGLSRILYPPEWLPAIKRHNLPEQPTA